MAVKIRSQVFIISLHLFKNALAELFKVKINKHQPFVESLGMDFVNLNKFADSVKSNDLIILEGKKQSKKEIKDNFEYYKLFFEDEIGSKSGEGEMFLNINENTKIVELREKDPEYREGLIGFFSQKK